MSRRHHGRSHQGGRYRHDPARPAQGTGPAAPPTSIDALSGPPEPTQPDAAQAPSTTSVDGSADSAPAVRTDPPAVRAQLTVAPPLAPGRDRAGPAPGNANGHPNGPVPGHVNGADRANGCTAPQLRRFIKSRPYVPMHELRRRFAIDGEDDDVTQVSMENGHVYVGLPAREGSLLGELLRGGEIGYELSLDPRTPVVVGVYPMRPVPRS